jgi:lipoprotein-releasing system ATP-binding protein
VLKGVDLRHQKGEISVSIVGASGAENNSLQILGTLDKPTVENGIELRINNEDILIWRMTETLSKLQTNLGFYFSFINYYLNLQH